MRGSQHARPERKKIAAEDPSIKIDLYKTPSGKAILKKKKGKVRRSVEPTTGEVRGRYLVGPGQNHPDFLQKTTKGRPPMVVEKEKQNDPLHKRRLNRRKNRRFRKENGNSLKKR